MVYFIAQEAAKHFGMPEGEAPVNKKLMEQFVEAQTLSKTCSSDRTISRHLRWLVNDMVKNLAIPLMQQLLYFMSEDNFQFVELYALSIVPQAISCDEALFDILRDPLFEEFKRDIVLKDTSVISGLAKLIDCLRI
jgi:hypothetical protein